MFYSSPASAIPTLKGVADLANERGFVGFRDLSDSFKTGMKPTKGLPACSNRFVAQGVCPTLVERPTAFGWQALS